MSFKGTVKDGVIVIPSGTSLAEGSEVEIVPAKLSSEQDSFLAAVEKLSKPRPHWPKDYTRELDHHLYGAPKKL